MVREKRLLASKCERCGNVSYPALVGALVVCPTCGPTFAKDVHSSELPTTGIVVTWTQLTVAPKGFRSPLIHCVLDVGTTKLFATVQGTSSIQEGDTLTIAEDPSGRFPFILCPLRSVPEHRKIS